ncbi:MAG: acyl-CoA dehydrogenase family protein [Nitrospirae bacterium]|nr:acyl-CoA dehydrogenase family protein [Nitrospirota bacterium]
MDLYANEQLLGPEERSVRDAVRQFVKAEFMPLVRRHHREGTFPIEIAPRLAALGVFGAHLKGYGCAGLGAVSCGLIMQELERGDSGLRSFASVQSSLCMTAIHQFGTEAHKQEWLPRLAKAERFACFGLTEPDFGSNPSGMRTTAREVNGGYVLNGTKMWITNGSIADVAVVWAKTGPGADSIRGFLVRKGTPGFSARDIHGKFSMRASITSDLVLEDVRVDEGDLLPASNGLKSALACLNQARYGIIWGVIGAARACFEEALDYAKTRVQFSRPIAGHQLVQEKLVRMATEITKAELLALRLASLKDGGQVRPAQISLAKMNNVEIALDVARMARDIMGANGILDDYQTIRHLLNLETVKTYEGTHNIHLLVVGQALTGIGAFD